MASSRSTRRVWPGAVVIGARLVKATSPARPSTGPAGLAKSMSSIVSRPELEAMSGARQSNRPVKAADPLTGDWTQSDASGLRSSGCRPSGVNRKAGKSSVTPPACSSPSCVSRTCPSGVAPRATSNVPVQRSFASPAVPLAVIGRNRVGTIVS